MSEESENEDEENSFISSDFEEEENINNNY